MSSTTNPDTPATKPTFEHEKTQNVRPPEAGWKKFVTPLVVILLAVAILITLTRNWNAWEGGKTEQVTDDAYVRGDLTPLSTKVAGIVRAVHVADYQQVHKGDLIVELEDDDYRAQVDQASAAVEAARAAIENNRRQRELQDTRIAKALAGIDQANAEIAAAQAGKEAVEGDLIRARSERKRQEDLYQAHSATQQKLETAVADEARLSAQFASRDADLAQARTLLRSNELGAEPKGAARRPFWNLKTYNCRPTCVQSKRTWRPPRSIWDIRRIVLQATELWANGKCALGSSFHPAHRSFLSLISRSGCWPITEKPN